MGMIANSDVVRRSLIQAYQEHQQRNHHDPAAHAEYAGQQPAETPTATTLPMDAGGHPIAPALIPWAGAAP